MDCESYGLLADGEELQSSNDFREIKIFHFPERKLIIYSLCTV